MTAGRPSMALATFTDRTAVARGDGAVRVLRKAGVPFQRVAVGVWHFPAPAVGQVVAAARRLRVDLIHDPAGDQAALW